MLSWLWKWFADGSGLVPVGRARRTFRAAILPRTYPAGQLERTYRTPVLQRTYTVYDPDEPTGGEMTLGTHDRAVDDVYALAVDFGPAGVFADGTTITATVTVEGATGKVAATTPAAISGLVARFTVSGGTVTHQDLIHVTATDGANILCRTIAVNTNAC